MDLAVTSEPAASAMTQVNVVGITNHPCQDLVLFRMLVCITFNWEHLLLKGTLGCFITFLTFRGELIAGAVSHHDHEHRITRSRPPAAEKPSAQRWATPLLTPSWRRPPGGPSAGSFHAKLHAQGSAGSATACQCGLGDASGNRFVK